MSSWILLASAALVRAQLSVTIDDSRSVHSTDTPYLHFNVDTGSIYNDFDWTDPVLINLVKGLNVGGGLLVRIGGSAADYSFVHLDSNTTQGPKGFTYITSTLLDRLVYFTSETNSSLLWDFNGLGFRNYSSSNHTLPPRGPWNVDANASGVLDYLQSKYAGQISWSWSLGNECDAWPSPPVSMTQLGLDAQSLKSALGRYNLGSEVYGASFQNVLATDLIQEYIQASKGIITGLTVHHYPMAGNCNIPFYLNRWPVDHMGAYLGNITSLARQYGDQGLKLVLEETAGSYAGGCGNITDRFASGFYFIPALGATAAAGFHRLHRQDIAGWSFTSGVSHYQLAGPPGWTNGSATLTPHPDYFTSVLWKQLIGPQLFNTSITGGGVNLTATVSVQGWCTAPAQGQDSSLVLSYANPTGVDVVLNLSHTAARQSGHVGQGMGSEEREGYHGDGITTAGPLPSAPRVEYILTSTAAEYRTFVDRLGSGRLCRSRTEDCHDGRAGQVQGRPSASSTESDDVDHGAADGPLDPPDTMSSDQIYLNGALLSVNSDGTLPVYPLPGHTVEDPTQPVVLPPYSYGFLVFPGVATAACS